MGLRTFTFVGGGSDKFWHIALEGNRFTVTYGRVGTNGQRQVKEFADAAAARKAHDKLVKEKLAKGYVETTGASAGPPLRQALEDAIAADFDDVAAHMAYADWLMEQGDPRGEFIRVQLALEDEGRSAAEQKDLREHGKALLKDHGRQWLGPLAEHLIDRKGVDDEPPLSAGWRCPGSGAVLRTYGADAEPDLAAWWGLFGAAFAQTGPKEVESAHSGWHQPYYAFRLTRGWLDTLRIGRLTEEFAAALAQAPAARMLQRLSVRYAENHGERIAVPPLAPFAGAAWIANLRAFRIGHPDDPCYLSAEGAADVIARMTRLEELRLFAHHAETERLFTLETLGNLRVLEVNHLSRYPLELLGENPALGRLTHLLIHPHALEPGDEGPYLTLPHLRAVVTSPHLTSLTHLQLRLSGFGDEGCELIVASGILKRLKVLDLYGGPITDRGAQLLASCPDVANLELLELSANAVTAQGIRALTEAGVKVRAENRWTYNPALPESWLHDTAFLYDGDME